MLEYKVIDGDSVRQADARVELEVQVREHVLTGWQPQGGVNLAVFEARNDRGTVYLVYIYSQAMVRGGSDE